MKLYQRLLATTVALAALTLVGCNNSPEPEMHSGNVTATSSAPAESGSPISEVTGMPASGAPQTPPGHPAMTMKEDPRSVKELEGKVDEVTTDMVVVAKGEVKLKFHLTATTVIKPDGKKLAKNEQVKIQIDQVPCGMNAKEIDIQ
ncbi:MAG TPA: hypothetical protein VGO93_22390 [Candidatus Xenobia bacterium]|jgi:hypothetical protein